MPAADDQPPYRTARPEDTPQPHPSPPRVPRGPLGLTADQERGLVFTLAAGLVLLRSAVFVFFDAVFDSDQAIVGLMAKHLSDGRTFPVFTYGQDYQLAIEAWIAAPLFWLFGPSVVALKLPLLAINIMLAVLLIALLERWRSPRCGRASGSSGRTWAAPGVRRPPAPTPICRFPRRTAQR